MARPNDDDLRRFAIDGYLVIPGVVPEPLLACADEEIDELISSTPPIEGDVAQPGQCAWFPPCARLPRCGDALRLSPALDIAQELVAPNVLAHAFDHIQVAITNPGWSHVPGGPHIDGHRPDQARPDSFTLLAGILLTDQRETQSGNLWVWPGSHLQHQELFRERGTNVLLESGGHAVMRGQPVEIKGQRGDLVLAHFLTGHNKGGNTSDHVRRTIYYRLAVAGHSERWEQTFLDAWAEYPRVAEGR